MAQTPLIDPTTSAATSTAFIVKGEAQVIMYKNEDTPQFGRAKIVFDVVRDEAGQSTYTAVMGRPHVQVPAYITNTQRSIILPSGTYVAIKSETDFPVGCFVQDAT